MRATPDPTPGQRLRAARQAARLTQAQLASRLGVGAVYLGDLERGKRPLSLDRLWEIAEAIGCDPRDLDERLACRA